MLMFIPVLAFLKSWRLFYNDILDIVYIILLDNYGKDPSTVLI